MFKGKVQNRYWNPPANFSTHHSDFWHITDLTYFISFSPNSRSNIHHFSIHKSKNCAKQKAGGKPCKGGWTTVLQCSNCKSFDVLACVHVCPCVYTHVYMCVFETDRQTERESFQMCELLWLKIKAICEEGNGERFKEGGWNVSHRLSLFATWIRHKKR